MASPPEHKASGGIIRIADQAMEVSGHGDQKVTTITVTKSVRKEKSGTTTKNSDKNSILGHPRAFCLPGSTSANSNLRQLCLLSERRSAIGHFLVLRAVLPSLPPCPWMPPFLPLTPVPPGAPLWLSCACFLRTAVSAPPQPAERP